MQPYTLTYFKLSDDCFKIDLDTKYFFESQQHKESFVRMEYAIESKYPFYLLTGFPGSGKTIITRMIISKLNSYYNDKYKTIYIDTSFDTFKSLYKELIYKLTDKPVTTNDEYELKNIYKDAVINLYQKDKYIVLFLDEAQNYNKKILEYVRQLINVSEIDKNFMTICLIGQPELYNKVIKIKQLDNRILLKYIINPFNRELTEHYIYFRLSKAGSFLRLFTPEAIDQIYINSSGVPREINSCCNNCLDAAAMKDKKKVSKDIAVNAISQITNIKLEEVGAELDG